jgi:hypothetical protein
VISASGMHSQYTDREIGGRTAALVAADFLVVSAFGAAGTYILPWVIRTFNANKKGDPPHKSIRVDRPTKAR